MPKSKTARQNASRFANSIREQKQSAAEAAATTAAAPATEAAAAAATEAAAAAATKATAAAAAETTATGATAASAAGTATARTTGTTGATCGRRGLAGQETFALHLLAGELAGAAHGLGLLTRFLLGRLFEVVPQLHLAENALALHLLLEGFERLIDIVVANQNLHAVCSSLV
jgi:hypothetical protein